MSMNDPIADMLTRLRNANQAGHEKVDIPFSNVKHKIISILKKRGFIKNFRVEGEVASKKIEVFFKLSSSKQKALQGLKRISHVGRRIYVDSRQISSVQAGIGISIISSSRGIITDYEARKYSIGGELICKVW